MFGNDWDIILNDEINKKYFRDLIIIIEKEYKNKVIYPPKNKLFKAFHNTPYKDIKVVILGQDPYHEKNQAEGISFSVPKGIVKPRSLQNIFKELHDDIGCKIPDHGSLIDWTTQGILLLNTVLTVEEGKPKSHSNIGWETFTDAVIRKINEKETPVVFILWGNDAKQKKNLITNPKHLIIESSHPSPYSASYGFFGSKPFSKTNAFLIKNGLTPINWEIK